jgi:two-component system, LytTR family, sensor kinase
MKFLRHSYFTKSLHIIVWAILLVIPSIVFRNQQMPGIPKGFFFITTIYHIGLFYLNAYFLYPRLLTRKRWPLYILAIAAIILFSNFAKVYFLQLDPNFNVTEENRGIIFFGLMPFLFASFIFRLVSDRIRFERLEKEARAERLDAELKFLRSQVSPHFLFNMLTSMVSLARQKSDLLEPSLIKLSELLRYMLYDSAETKIPLGREIDHIENYIALQQLRFGEDVQVELEIEKDCSDCPIEPMLLVPFIENAFKHGIVMFKKPFIKVVLIVKGQLLEFSVTNNYSLTDISKDKNSGIGLMNVKNRLKLLYPKKYELVIADADGIFSVQLNLDLS